MKIASLIFGIGAMLALFSLYQQKTHKGLLCAKLIADACWVGHYLCIGGAAGAIPNFVGIFRELIFVRRKKHRWANWSIWPFLFIAVNFGLGLRTFYSAFNILPIAASALVTILLWIDNPFLTKLLSIPVCASFLIYDIHIGSYIGFVSEAVSLLSILLFLFNFLIKRRNKNDEKCIF